MNNTTINKEIAVTQSKESTTNDETITQTEPTVQEEPKIEETIEPVKQDEPEEGLFGNQLSVLDEVESELSKESNGDIPPFLDSQKHNEEISSFTEEPIGLPEEEFTPPTEEDSSFIDMIMKDIENGGGDYIEFVDELPVGNESQEYIEKSNHNEEPVENGSHSLEASEIFSILDNSTKDFKNEYLNKEAEFLAALKKKKLPVFKLFTSAQKVWAVSKAHMVVEFADSLKSTMISKKSNQEVLKSVFSAVFGRELEIKAYTSDVLNPIIDQYRTKK